MRGRVQAGKGHLWAKVPPDDRGARCPMGHSTVVPKERKFRASE